MADDKLRLDPGQLTPNDLRRAKVALGGKNPWELLEDPLEAVVLTIWCLRSREDPAFTWEQAGEVPLGSFTLDDAEEERPPVAMPSMNGSAPVPVSGTDARVSPTSAASTP